MRTRPVRTAAAAGLRGTPGVIAAPSDPEPFHVLGKAGHARWDQAVRQARLQVPR